VVILPCGYVFAAGVGREKEVFLELLARRDMALMVAVLLVGVGWSQEENMLGRKESAVDAAVCALLVGRSAVVGA
jgi:hypothetical protein